MLLSIMSFQCQKSSAGNIADCAREPTDFLLVGFKNGSLAIPNPFMTNGIPEVAVR